MVTNPATRDWTVTASLFATLNEMYGNRTVCGIGRGDSAVRVTNGRPTTLATLRDSIHVIRELANGREVDYRGSTLRFPWGTASELEVWVAAYGPKALALAGEVGDGFILQLADPDITAWSVGAVRDAAERAGRDPDAVTICVAAPAYVGDDVGHMRTSAVGSAGWSATTSPTSWAATATAAARCPQALDRLHQGPAGLRLQRARPQREHPRRRSSPTRSSIASASSARRPSTSPGCEELAGARRRPVRHLPPARWQAADAGGLRRDRDPRGRRRRSRPSDDGEPRNGMTDDQTDRAQPGLPGRPRPRVPLVVGPEAARPPGGRRRRGQPVLDRRRPDVPRLLVADGQHEHRPPAPEGGRGHQGAGRRALHDRPRPRQRQAGRAGPHAGRPRAGRPRHGVLHQRRRRGHRERGPHGPGPHRAAQGARRPIAATTAARAARSR